MLSRRDMLATGVGLGAGLVTAACTRADGSGADGSPRTSPSGATKRPVNPVGITVSPAPGAKNVLPTRAIEVRAAHGTLTSVTVTNGRTSIEGELDAQRAAWRSTGSLRYGKTYAVKVSGVDASGSPAQYTATFTTVKPVAVASVFFQSSAMAAIKAGATYGVGQPVIVHFNRRVTDRKAAEQAMQVVTEPAVEGRWRWMDSSTAHWRPAKYWKPGTRITVNVRAYGVHLGKGVYGGQNSSTDFAIGASRIAIADASTHRMKCYVNGKLVKDIPISVGKGGSAKTSDGRTVDFWTRSGQHVILTKEPEHRMTSASFGISDKNDPNFYDEVIKLCCRISYTGEFVHLADWNIPAHGHSNTSHGCVNVGPGNAQWFFSTFQIGDVVEVRGTPKKMQQADGLGDWLIPWNKW